MKEFTQFENPWSADNSEWFNEEQDKWFDGGEFTEWLREVPEDKVNYRKRPGWKEVYEGYPKNATGGDRDAPLVFKEIFGDDYDEVNKILYENKGKASEKRISMADACATRVSLGLLNANFNINRRQFTILQGEMKGKGIITSAIVLKNWLLQSIVLGIPDIYINTRSGKYKGKEGTVSLKLLQEEIGNRNGIYIIIPYRGCFSSATGHTTLWVSSEGNAISGNSYPNCIGEVLFWELI